MGWDPWKPALCGGTAQGLGVAWKMRLTKKNKIETDSCTKEAWAIYEKGRNANTIACKFLILTFNCMDNSVPKE